MLLTVALSFGVLFDDNCEESLIEECKQKIFK
mgnify:CR=1 FL=1